MTTKRYSTGQENFYDKVVSALKCMGGSKTEGLTYLREFSDTVKKNSYLVLHSDTGATVILQKKTKEDSLVSISGSNLAIRGALSHLERISGAALK